LVSDEKSTVVINLPNSNYLSALQINIRATNGATAGAQYPPQMIKQILVLADGSKEIVSLTGEEAYLLYLALTGYLPPRSHSLSANATQRTSLLIPFGRKLGDPEYFLDCSQFSSLELRITFDATVGATGIVDNSLYLEVLGLMAMEGAPGARRGTLKTSRKYNFVTASSGDASLDMPRANPYRAIFIATIGANTTVDGTFSRLQLDVNNAEKIIVSGRVAGLKYMDAIEGKRHDSDAAIGDIMMLKLDTADDMANCLNSAAFDKVTLTLTQATGSITTSVLLQEVLL
jgi:hypothetical protein